MMKTVLCVIFILGLCTVVQPAGTRTPARPAPVVIAVSTLLDGRGHVIRNTRILIEGSEIIRIDPKAGPVDYDLRGFTVMPGWIDAHVHTTWSFNREGKNAG